MYKLFKSHANKECQLILVITKNDEDNMLLLDEVNDFDKIFTKTIEYKKVLETMGNNVEIKLRF